MLCGRRLVPWILWSVVMAHAPAISAQVQISGLSDLHLGSWSGVGDLEGVVDHCVLGPRGGRFAIEATGAGSGGAFVLESGPGSLPFQVTYDDGAAGARWTRGSRSPGWPVPPIRTSFSVALRVVDHPSECACASWRKTWAQLWQGATADP
jgi:hypothetical protein